MQALRLIAQGTDELTSGSGLETAVTLTDAKGAFTLLAVPAGQYVLRALRVPQAPRPATPGLPAPIPPEPTLWAAEPVVVADQNVALDVTLKPGLRVSGRFDFRGGASLPSPDRLQQIPVTIEPVDNRDGGAIPPGHGDAAGGFTTFGLLPGRYFIRVGGSPRRMDVRQRDARRPGCLRRAIRHPSRRHHRRRHFVHGHRRRRRWDRQFDQGRTGCRCDGAALPADPAGWREFGLNPRRIRKRARKCQRRLQHRSAAAWGVLSCGCAR